MIAEMYHAMFLYLVNNGPYLAWLVFTTLFAIFLFIPVGLVSFYYRKKKKPLKLGTQLVWYFVLVFLGWGIILGIEGLDFGHILDIWKLALLGVVIYIPAWWVYNKALEKWERLPWHVLQFAVIWVISAIIWFYLIFVFQAFGYPYPIPS